MSSSKSIREALRWATEQLRERCGESARLEAELLIAHILQKTRLELYVCAHESLAPAQCAQLDELLERRRQGEPLQYLLGYTEFHGCHLRLTPSVLIPRPETEELVSLILSDYRDKPPLTVLDLGTGSGAIAIALARAWTTSSFVATDISSEALALARENARRNGVADRIRFVRSDWFSDVSEQFDLIVSNPPYVRTEYLEQAPRELSYEPWTALDGGPEGLNALSVIIRESPRHLRAGGALYLEIGSDQGARVYALLQKTRAFAKIAILKDLAGHERFVRAICLS